MSFGEPVYATLYVSAERGTNFQLELWWPCADPRDGDRYRIDVTDVSGGAVVSLPETAVDYVDSSEDGLVGDECHSIQLRSEASAP